MSEAELAAWLIENGYAEEKSGYGHVSGAELAAALTAKFEIHPKFPAGTVRGTEKY